MATNTAKRTASPTFGYISDIKIPPQLKADPEGIFEFYQKRGLIDPKYKSIVDWQNAVLKRANNAGWEVAKTLNKMNLEWLMSSRGKKLLSQNFTAKHLKQLEQAMKRSSSAVGPFKFQGIPIERVRYKDKAEAIADGWKIIGNRLPFRTLQASPRAYGERIPLEMEDWFKTLEANGTIPKGTFKKYATWVYKINDANKARATNFSKRVGIPKFFNKGHLAAILNNTYFGGSNDPASQVLELTLENIKHGATDAISLEDMRKLDLPTNWGESAAYFMVNELGIKDNRILTGTGLPMRWSGKDMLLDSDIARITRFGENPDVILAETQNRLEQLAQEIEANRVKGLGDAESLKQIQSRIVDGRYVAPTITEQLSKAEVVPKNQTILGFIPKKAVNTVASSVNDLMNLPGARPLLAAGTWTAKTAAKTVAGGFDVLPGVTGTMGLVSDADVATKTLHALDTSDALLSTAAWFPKLTPHVGTPLATLMVGKTVGELQEGGDRKLREEVDEEHTGNIGGSLIGRPLGWQNPF